MKTDILYSFARNVLMLLKGKNARFRFFLTICLGTFIDIQKLVLKPLVAKTILLCRLSLLSSFVAVDSIVLVFMGTQQYNMQYTFPVADPIKYA